MLIEYTAPNSGCTIAAKTDTLAVRCRLDVGDGINADMVIAIEEDPETHVTGFCMTPADAWLPQHIKLNQPRVVNYLRKRAETYANLNREECANLCHTLADEIEHGEHLPAVTSW